MTAARRYAFDTVFDADGAVLREGARARSFTLDEVERERAAAHEAGRAEQAAKDEARTAAALAQIAEAARLATTRLVEDRRALHADAARLALVAARAVAGAALERFGEAQVAAAVDAAFESFVGAPRLVVRVAPALQGVRAAIEETARAQGFDGAIVVRADPSVRAGDATIDWGDGAVASDSEDAFARIEAAVTAALARLEGHES